MSSPLRSPFRNIANCVLKVVQWTTSEKVDDKNQPVPKSRSVSPEIPKLEEPAQYVISAEYENQNMSTEKRSTRSGNKQTPKSVSKNSNGTPKSKSKSKAGQESELRRSRRKLPFEEVPKASDVTPVTDTNEDHEPRKSRRKLSLQLNDAAGSTPASSPRKSRRDNNTSNEMKMVLKKKKDSNDEWTAHTPTKSKVQSKAEKKDILDTPKRSSRRNTPCKGQESIQNETPVKERNTTTRRVSRQLAKVNDQDDEDWTVNEKESDSEDDFVIKTRSPSKRYTPRKNLTTPAKSQTPKKSARVVAAKQNVEAKLLRTPKGRKASIEAVAHRDTPAKRRKTMTPRVPARSVPLADDKSSLAEAQLRLHVGAVPDSLPCREDEFAQILSFTEGKIFDGTGGCMYISGVPGTGKTATVKEVIRTLQSYTDMGDLPAFDFIEINGMRLTEPNQAYAQLWKAMTGAKVTTEHAKNLLEKRFTTTNAPVARKQKTSVVLVDELDLLWNRKQSVLYNIFEWPNNKFSKLVVLAIANTMDLPERVMINRVSSRIGLTRLTFSPYTHQQLQEIVCSRLNGLSIFDKDAIQLVARKVASLSGDARRALDICRRASEIAESEGKETMVNIGHVTRAHKEMFCSPKMMAIRSCSKYEKVFMQAMVAVFQKIGIEETPFDRVLQSMNEVLKFESLDTLSVDEAFNIVGRLTSSRLILTEPGKAGRLDMKLRLNVSQEDVLFALKPE